MTTQPLSHFIIFHDVYLKNCSSNMYLMSTFLIWMHLWILSINMWGQTSSELFGFRLFDPSPPLTVISCSHLQIIWTRNTEQTTGWILEPAVLMIFWTNSSWGEHERLIITIHPTVEILQSRAAPVVIIKKTLNLIFLRVKLSTIKFVFSPRLCRNSSLWLAQSLKQLINVETFSCCFSQTSHLWPAEVFIKTV